MLWYVLWSSCLLFKWWLRSSALFNRPSIIHDTFCVMKIKYIIYNIQDYAVIHDNYLYVFKLVYMLGDFHKNRNNSTVFEEFEVSIVDLTVTNIRFTGSVSHRQSNCICDRQIHYFLCYILKIHRKKYIC
jgi:hypothetical protein